MAILTLGLILFLGSHSLRMAAPRAREAAIARIGEQRFKGLYSLVALAGFVLIIWGFGRAAEDPVLLYVPPFWLRRVTEFLMLVALILAVASPLPPGHLSRAVRHPLLIATALWAIAHLFVNGEAATTILFGAFLAWAVIDLFAQRYRPRAERPAPAWRFDAIAVAAGVVLYALLVWRAHEWLFGVSPIA